MSLVLIRQKARELRAKTLRQLLGTLVVPLVVAFFYVFCIKQFPQVGPVLHTLFGFALAWSLAGLYFLHRAGWPGAIPEDSGFKTSVEFCRAEIERQRHVFRRLLLWSFGPVVLAFGTIILANLIVAGTSSPKALPFITLVVVWIASYFFIRARQQRELQREIDELRDVDRENSRK